MYAYFNTPGDARIRVPLDAHREFDWAAAEYGGSEDYWQGWIDDGRFTAEEFAAQAEKDAWARVELDELPANLQ